MTTRMPLADQELIMRADAYAAAAHAAVGQLQKYTGAPYIVHPRSVAAIVRATGCDASTIAAALLHDVMEDTGVTFADLQAEFGEDVAQLVDQVTDKSKPSDGKRAVRKAIDREHAAGISARAKTVKLADMIDNLRTVTDRDPKFARVYLQEKALLLDVLKEGDSTLYRSAQNHLAMAQATLGAIDDN